MYLGRFCYIGFSLFRFPYVFSGDGESAGKIKSESLNYKL
jgi:hypothetical protein